MGHPATTAPARYDNRGTRRLLRLHASRSVRETSADVWRDHYYILGREVG